MASDNDLLQALLAPASVAIVGASDDAGKAASRPLRFLQKHGFSGRVYPINAHRAQVQGQACYQCINDVPETIQHATILVGGNKVETALQQCIEAGVKVVSVFSDGFADAGEAGLERQLRLQSMADEADILLIGPNSTGVVVTHSCFYCTTNAAFTAGSQRPGRFAVLSQSGSVIGTLYSRGEASGIGFSVLVSVGNEIASIGRLGQLLLEDPGTEGFMLFLETLREREQLRDFALRARAHGKPVVAYMIGQSFEGQRLSVSHTGALLGASAAIDSYLAACGIYRVELFETLLEAPAALGNSLSVDRPRTVAVVSTTGGGGAMLIDQLSVRRVEITGCGGVSRKLLESEGIPLGQGKLIDVTMAGTRYDVMKRVVSTLMEDPQIGILIVAIGSSAQFNSELAVQPVIDAVAEAGSDVAIVMAFPLPHAPESLSAFRRAGIAAFRSVESCAESVALLMEEHQPTLFRQASLPEQVRAVLASLPAGAANEYQAARVRDGLEISGPPSLFIPSGHELPEPLSLDWPVAVKVVSADIAHKSDIGAVVLNVCSAEQLTLACAKVSDAARDNCPAAKIAGVLVQQMVCDAVAEILFGYTIDPVAGPVVSVATGGVYAELLSDAVSHPAPVSLQQAVHMINKLRGRKLLYGYRGKANADVDALANTLVKFSQLAACARVREMELNPVLALPHGVAAVDALLVLS